jgi:hypothetical protein
LLPDLLQGLTSMTTNPINQKYNLYSKESLLTTTNTEHVDQYKEDSEIEQEELENDEEYYE